MTLSDGEVVALLRDHGWSGMTAAQAFETIVSNMPCNKRLPPDGDLMRWLADARLGQHGAFITKEEVVALINEPDTLALLAFLRAHGCLQEPTWDFQRLGAAHGQLTKHGFTEAWGDGDRE